MLEADPLETFGPEYLPVPPLGIWPMMMIGRAQYFWVKSKQDNGRLIVRE